MTTYTGLAAESQQFLDRWNTKIQARGWHCNTEHGVVLAPPDTAIVIGDTTGTFITGETVAETTSGATARYCYTQSGLMYLTQISGTLTGGLGLTGATSGAYVAGGAAAAVASGFIYVDSDILSADIENSPIDVVLRGGRFFNRDENTYTFDSSITIEQIRKLPFADLSDALQELISVNAMIDLCSKNKLPLPVDTQKRLAEAQLRAAQDDNDASDIDMQSSLYFRQMMGRSGTRMTPR